MTTQTTLDEVRQIIEEGLAGTLSRRSWKELRELGELLHEAALHADAARIDRAIEDES
jgi:hypothetical protein